MNSPLQAAQTGYVFDERYLLHVIEDTHPESPERLVFINSLLSECGLLEKCAQLKPLLDVEKYIRKIHTETHISSIIKIPTTGFIAKLAVGGACAAVKAVHEGTIKNAFCAVRPPGHHAHDSGREEGFCYFNNIAIAAKYAQELGHAKILIIDWDYHHGNGTQDAFYDDPTILFFSTHALYAYPGTGSPASCGEGPKQGLNINVGLPHNAGDADIIAAWNARLIPAANTFKPDFVLISAGFDSRIHDPLGDLAVTDAGFAKLTAMAMDIAKTHCNGRLVSILEGGYNPQGLALAVAAHIEKLLEI
jgi:Deacetylases, including yeast histone deacetylase and acetoin utilization protein